MFRGFLTITFVALFVQQSLSSLSKDELHKAVDGFDSFFEPPRSNDAKDKEDFITTDVAPEVATFRPLEDVPDVSTKKPERVIPVREEVVEEEIVTEKAKCVVGCLINLNVSNPDLIQFAKDSLKSVPNGNNFELVQLIQAVREVQNRIIYYLTIEAVEKCEKEGGLCSDTVLCVIKIERHPWRLTKPLLTYQNCTEESSSNSSEAIKDNDSLINPFDSIPNVQNKEKEHVEGTTHSSESTTVNIDEIISSLNQEIIVAENDNHSNQEPFFVQSTIPSDEITQASTLSAEELYLVNETVTNSGESSTKISVSDYETSTVHPDVTSTEQNSPDVVTQISKSDDVATTEVLVPN